MVDYLTPFAPQQIGVNEIHNAGSLALFAPLPTQGSKAPVEATLTPAAALAAATSLTLTTDQTGGTWLRSGSILYLGAKTAVVTETTKVLTAGTPVPVEPLAAAIAVTDLAKTWGLLQLLSPINIPLNSTDSSEDRTDLTYYLQGSEVKTKVMSESQISVFDRADDRAYNELVDPAAKSGVYVFAHLFKNGGKHQWGRVQVSGSTDDGAVAALAKPQFTLKWQAPYAQPTRYAYLESAQQTLMNSVMKLSGLAIYS